MLVLNEASDTSLSQPPSLSLFPLCPPQQRPVEPSLIHHPPCTTVSLSHLLLIPLTMHVPKTALLFIWAQLSACLGPPHDPPNPFTVPVQVWLPKPCEPPQPTITPPCQTIHNILEFRGVAVARFDQWGDWRQYKMMHRCETIRSFCQSGTPARKGSKLRGQSSWKQQERIEKTPKKHG